MVTLKVLVCCSSVLSSSENRMNGHQEKAWRNPARNLHREGGRERERREEREKRKEGKRREGERDREREEGEREKRERERERKEKRE